MKKLNIKISVTAIVGFLILAALATCIPSDFLRPKPVLAGYYTTIIDGAYADAAAGSWGDVRDSASETMDKASGSFQVGVNDSYDCIRSFFVFDTSGLPDTCTIVDADIQLWTTATADDYSTVNTSIYAVDGGSYPQDSIADTDFNRTHYSYGATDILAVSDDFINAMGTGDYNWLSWQGDELSHISKTGYTRFALIHSFDQSDTDPGTPAGSESYITYDSPTGTHPPRLLIDIIIPPSLGDLASIITDVRCNQMTAECHISGYGGEASCAEYGFVWDTHSNSKPGSTDAPSSLGYSYVSYTSGPYYTGEHYGNLTSLSPNQDYYIRAYCKNTYYYNYSDIQSSGSVGAPTTAHTPSVTSGSPTSYATTSVTINNNVIDALGLGDPNTSPTYAGTTVGIQYDTDGAPFAYDETEAYAGSPFDITLSGLSIGTLYYYRAHAATDVPDASVGYGSTWNFWTLSNGPTPGTLIIRAGYTQESTEIPLQWTKGTGDVNTKIMYRTDHYPTSYTDGTQGYYGTDAYCTVTGLTPGEKYFFRAWGINGGGASSGAGYAELTTYSAPGAVTITDQTPEDDNKISFDWTRAVGDEGVGNKTLIKYSTTGYPATTADGTLGYFDTGLACDITGLSPGTLYYFRFWDYSTVSGLYSDIPVDTTEYTLPSEVPVLTASTISGNRIDLTWTKGSGQDSSKIRTIVRYLSGSTHPSDPAGGDGSTAAYPLGTGTYCSVTGLDYTTEYSFSAWSYYTDSTYYSLNPTESEATTKSAPTITTDTATDISMSTALLWSTVTEDSDESCYVRFVYGETLSMTEETDWISGYRLDDAASAYITGLTSGTLYYYQAQIYNTVNGITDPQTGSTENFTASDVIFKPTSLQVTNVTDRSISLSWFKGSGAENTVIRYKTTGYPTTHSDGTLAYNDVGTSVTVDNLTPGITYYFGAWSWADGDPDDYWSDREPTSGTYTMDLGTTNVWVVDMVDAGVFELLSITDDYYVDCVVYNTTRSGSASVDDYAWDDTNRVLVLNAAITSQANGDTYYIDLFEYASATTSSGDPWDYGTYGDFFANPDATNLVNFPGYGVVSDWSTGTGMSIANSFVLLALLFAIFAGIVVFLLSRSIGAAVFATSLVMMKK